MKLLSFLLSFTLMSMAFATDELIMDCEPETDNDLQITFYMDANKKPFARATKMVDGVRVPLFSARFWNGRANPESDSFCGYVRENKDLHYFILDPKKGELFTVPPYLGIQDCGHVGMEIRIGRAQMTNFSFVRCHK